MRLTLKCLCILASLSTMLILGACTEEAVTRPEPTVEPEPDFPKLEALALEQYYFARGARSRPLSIIPEFHPDSVNYRVLNNNLRVFPDWIINELGIYAEGNSSKSVITVRFNDSLIPFSALSRTYDYRTDSHIQGTFVVTVNDTAKNIEKAYSISIGETPSP